MTPSLYDLLDVEPSATEAEIRAAWKAAIADLEPTDRRFRVLNQAAGVLLDPSSRAAHDEDLAADENDEGDGGEDDGEDAAVPPTTAPSVTLIEKSEHEPEPAPVPASEPEPEPVVTTTGGDATRGLRRLCRGLGVVAALLLVLTVVVFVRTDGSDGGASAAASGSQADAALAAAEVAVVPVLSYDYRTLPEDSAAAQSYLTPEYRAKYEQYFAAAVETNAPRTQTVVEVSLVSSGIVRTGKDLVDVLLFVDRPTTNRQLDEPIVYKDQVTLQMRLVDGDWLVDDLVTTGPVPQ